jgi:hypothetical protein
MDEESIEDFKDKQRAKIKALNETIWESKAPNPKVKQWLDNFSGKSGEKYGEQVHALYLLSHFIYFGEKEIRELLRSLYRDLFKYPIIKDIRERNRDTLDSLLVEREFDKELKATRFLGLGNPAESGTHLLYYFRQENALPENLFIHGHEIFKRYGDTGNLELRSNIVKRYVFIDDLCSSGSQASRYSKELLEDLKELKPDVKIMYYPLFGLQKGLGKLKNTKFDSVEAVFMLDDSFKIFSVCSRYFITDEKYISKEFAHKMCEKYGDQIFPSHPLGYKKNQLLLGFHHNIPNNTLPIIWSEGTTKKEWSPIFRRYQKLSLKGAKNE